MNLNELTSALKRMRFYWSSTFKFCGQKCSYRTTISLNENSMTSNFLWILIVSYNKILASQVCFIYLKTASVTINS